MAQIGYVRVSTQDQNLDLQQDAMEAAGVTKVFQDLGISGSRTDRPGLDAALAYLREGDTLVVWRLDRLGRNLPHVRAVVEDLKGRGIGFRSLTEGITTDGAMGTLLLTILGAFAEFEKNVLVERTQAGLAAARLRGNIGGRPPKLTPKQVERMRKLKADGLTVPELAGMFKVSVPTAYRALAS
jgi:DNA invertase Pin-like site-specific DNA recombinase